nr:cysteine/serine-rich nuclear protein 1-like [Nerophis lumbriciformis]
MAGVLKRMFAAVEENPTYSYSSLPSPSPPSSEWGSYRESNSPKMSNFTVHRSSATTSLSNGSIVKKPRRVKSVRFDQVAVFSFPRCQGFTSVPSHGGATLGMLRQHSALRRYTVAEHALEQRSRRRQRHLLRIREEKFELLKHNITNQVGSQPGHLTIDQVPSEDVDVHITDHELEEKHFLQPYSSRQRQALLLASGVKRIDKEEKKQLHNLRLSREACGCDCQGFCDPETCACSLAGIKCQVDRFSFPCGCTKDGCGNTEGHLEFDSKRVRTHYIHTVMRLNLEQRLRTEMNLSEDVLKPEDLNETHPIKNEKYKRYSFDFSMEENVTHTVPTSPTFNFIPVVEENSCSSDMTEFSSSSLDCDECHLPANHKGAPLRLLAAPLTVDSGNCDLNSTSPDRTGLLSENTFIDHKSPVAVRDYLDENANQAKEPFDNEDSLEGYPNTPSPSLDYSSSTYMDPSLSSESDLEFFDSDYPSGAPHSSFKEHRHSDNFHHLQLISSVYLPQVESSTYLLESLIGLSEPISGQPHDHL